MSRKSFPVLSADRFRSGSADHDKSQQPAFSHLKRLWQKPLLFHFHEAYPDSSPHPEAIRHRSRQAKQHQSPCPLSAQCPPAHRLLPAPCLGWLIPILQIRFLLKSLLFCSLILSFFLCFDFRYSLLNSTVRALFPLLHISTILTKFGNRSRPISYRTTK